MPKSVEKFRMEEGKMNLFYRKQGQGKPLFILHGLFGSSDNWQSIGKKFAENYEVYLIDQRNHGQSFHSDFWTYEWMSKDILDLMELCSLKKITLIGHSMGGKAAMHFALSYPERIEKLIVVDIGPKYYPVHHQKILEALTQLDLTKNRSRKDAERALSENIQNQDELQFLLKNLYWVDVQSNLLAWRFNLAVINRNIEIVGEAQENRSSSLTFPTLFLRGEKSNYVLEEDFDAIFKTFPTSSIQTIKDAGHWVQAEQATLFFEACTKFLQQ